MEWLEALVLDGNNITSNIPESIGKMAQLQVLRLHDNFITGTIPNSIAGLKKLFLLGLHVSMSAANDFIWLMVHLTWPIMKCGYDITYVHTHTAVPTACTQFSFSTWRTGK